MKAERRASSCTWGKSFGCSQLECQKPITICLKGCLCIWQGAQHSRTILKKHAAPLGRTPHASTLYNSSYHGRQASAGCWLADIAVSQQHGAIHISAKSKMCRTSSKWRCFCDAVMAAANECSGHLNHELQRAPRGIIGVLSCACFQQGHTQAPTQHQSRSMAGACTAATWLLCRSKT